MKKLIIIGTLFTGTLLPATEIILESNLLKLVDGFLINANTIELTRHYQRDLLHIVYGTKDSHGSRIGDYEFNGKKYTVHDLSQIEQEITEKKSSYSAQEYEQLTIQLQATLLRAKDDFIEKSKKMHAMGAGSKHITSKLIEESCRKRGRRNSVLLIWSAAPEEKENDVLYQEVHSFIEFEQFVVDMLNFFDDLIHSCPKAQEKFKARLQKWTKLKELMPQLLAHNEQNAHLEAEFLKYFKEHHIDAHTLEQINKTIIQKLLNEFKKTHS